MAKTLTFSGHVYNFHEYTKTKQQANRKAKELREDGFLARVVKEKGYLGTGKDTGSYYAIYARRRQ